MFIIVIDAIETNDFSVSTDPILGFVVDLIFGSIASPALNSVAGLISGSIISLTFGSVNNSVSGSITVLALGTVAGRIASMIMDPKTTFFYGKQVTQKNYINSKLYIKKLI